MILHLFLLLTLLGPGNSLQPWDTPREGAKGSSGPALLRGRRQVGGGDDYDYPDYPYYTDPPEILNITNAVTTNPEAQTTLNTMEQRVFVRPGTSELATVESAATGGAAVGKLGTKQATGAETTQPAVTEAEITQPEVTEAETTQPSVTEAETTQPAVIEPETTQPEVTEAETTQLAVTEAETTPPAVTEAETTQPAVTEVETTQLAVTEAETTQPAVTEAETTQLPWKSKAIKVLFTETLSTVPVTTKFLSTERTESTIFLGSSVIQEDTTVASNKLPDISMKKGQLVTPGSSVAPSPTEASDLIPVRQCLLAILILALLATVFLVCTVVLAVRLSRKNHMYPVRNYSPTEMVCISSLLPEGGEGTPVMANGGLPKSQGLKAEPSEDRDGDDLTLHSFLP